MKFLSWLLFVCLLFSGAAWSQQMSIKQRVLMPGEVIEAHAEFEAQCEKCHASFDKAAMPTLCLDCHDEIRADRNSKTGFHGQSPLASVKPCNTCHTDHLGRDADIIAMQIDAFSHDWTRFPLVGKHAPLACTSCHEAGKKYRDAEPECASCALPAPWYTVWALPLAAAEGDRRAQLLSLGFCAYLLPQTIPL